MLINIIKLLYLLFTCVNSEKMIKNINIPACKNCIYYKPKLYDDFTSSFNRCENFGEKDIITDKIEYNFADSCRNDESKCGKEGKFFIKEQNINIKILQHSIIKNISFIIPFMLLFLNIIAKFILSK